MANQDTGSDQAAIVDFDPGVEARPGGWQAVKSKMPQRMVHTETGFAGGDFVPGNYAGLRDIKKDDRLRKISEKQDFITGTESQAMERIIKRKTNTVAKQIWEDHREAIENYARATQELRSRTQKDLNEPSDQTKRLLEIVEAGPPMTKQRALAMAKHMVTATLKKRGA